MKKLYRLFRRSHRYYCEHVETRRQTSLGTSNQAEALRLIAAKNEAAQNPTLNLALARTYLNGHDTRMLERTWSQVMTELADHGGTSSRERCERAMRSRPFDALRDRRLVETSSDELLAVLKKGGNSTNHYLRRLHNLAVGLGWLPWEIIPSRLWPGIRKKKRRGITEEEHRRIIQAEGNSERRDFYELLWEIGSAQTDAAMLRADDIDWPKRVLSYQRRKTGEWAHLMIGEKLEALLKRLPACGPLFPNLRNAPVSARSAEFCRRCRVVGIKGVSLHSYRYAWAERARAAGYPERWAQNALGHNSRAVHEAYAKGAIAVCPPLESYERKIAAIHKNFDAVAATNACGFTIVEVEQSRRNCEAGSAP